MTTTTWLSTTRDRRPVHVANCARRMIVSSSRLQTADLQHPESPRLLVPDPQLLIFECTRLTFVPPDPIIVCPKSCLYPSLHIRRTFPSSSSFPLHNPTSISQARPGKQWGGPRTKQQPNLRSDERQVDREGNLREGLLSGGKKAHQVLCRPRG
jgi:hypothetical protein